MFLNFKIIKLIKNINAIFRWYNNYFAHFPIIGVIYSLYFGTLIICITDGYL